MSSDQADLKVCATSVVKSACDQRAWGSAGLQACLAVTERLTRIFRDALHIDPPSTHTDLFDTGVLDSLAFVELLLRLEQEFGVTVSLDDLELDNFRTIDRIASFVQERSALPPLRLVHPVAR